MYKRYHVTTFGCQMNAHDSERIKGMLESIGLGEATSQEEADVMVFNTCTIREKPDQRLAAHLAQAKALKDRDPDRVIAVGGCYAEAQREQIFEPVPVRRRRVRARVDPASRGLDRGRRRGAARPLRRVDALRRRPSRPARAAVSGLGAGVDGLQLQVRLLHRPAQCGGGSSRAAAGEIVAEVTALAADGVREITLLGQNVNSYGRDLLPEVKTGFAELLDACDAVDGIERIRFTSPHPKDFRPDVIEAMASCAAVCEHAHLPLQSGSTRVLKRMRRTYSRERYVELVADMRAAIPDLALTTDLIVGFPGETEDDFRQTVELVDEVGFDGAFTFVFSPRSGTEAAAMPDQIADEVKRDRIERLIEVVQRSAADRNAERVGAVEEVLVEGPSRTDPSVLRGRTRRNTTVNFSGTAAAGELVPVRIVASTSTTLRGEQVALVAA